MAKCSHCQKIATDPVKGPSLWTRVVVGTEQILICPECQSKVDWERQARVCPRCGSKKLSKALGDIICRACGNHEIIEEFDINQ